MGREGAVREFLVELAIGRFWPRGGESPRVIPEGLFFRANTRGNWGFIPWVRRPNFPLGITEWDIHQALWVDFPSGNFGTVWPFFLDSVPQDVKPIFPGRIGPGRLGPPIEGLIGEVLPGGLGFPEFSR